MKKQLLIAAVAATLCAPVAMANTSSGLSSGAPPGIGIFAQAQAGLGMQRLVSFDSVRTVAAQILPFDFASMPVFVIDSGSVAKSIGGGSSDIGMNMIAKASATVGGSATFGTVVSSNLWIHRGVPQNQALLRAA
jgi:hypothetical protein